MKPSLWNSIPLMLAVFISLTGCATVTDGAVRPDVVDVRNVLATPAAWAGRDALSVVLTPQEQAGQQAGAGANRPTYAVIDQDFTDGVIEVEIAAVKNGQGGANTRGFAGIAFHLSPDLEMFEAVYLRMDNGVLNTPLPEAPRDVRAVQYVAHPNFHFEVSREQFPGRYEAAAPIRTGGWHRLTLQIDGPRMQVQVDGIQVLAIDDLKRAGQTGRIGLWVGDGSIAYFRNLRVTPAS